MSKPEIVKNFKGVMMSHVLIRHKVNDFTAWKEAFDNFKDVRKEFGEKSFQVLQHTEDSNNLYVMLEWDSVENAHKFLESPQLKTAMQEAGVAEAPEINYLIEAFKGTL
jgi:quinol monooxygenase YgiN